ncbi:MAG: DUF3179 domain-containing protein [Chitinophagaceae bacterium]|nr:DUF3179 domain-containing protein [Chitinophagaceae bacterium]
MKNGLLVFGITLLILAEIARVYFIMPMPGSQRMNSIQFAYWIGMNIIWVRLLAFALVIVPAIAIFRAKKWLPKLVITVFVIIYGVVFYLFNFKMEADTMFLQPAKTVMVAAKDNKVPANKLVVGIVINGEARAYPIQFIGYHHQVKDGVAKEPVMVTYCTVCRTGRVFSPKVNGSTEIFRLVGMDHFNAMFEDATTKSWWQQATGKAIIGPLKGTALAEIPSEQMQLSAWLEQYPNSLIMQGDTVYNDTYQKMDVYDKGLSKGNLTRRDSGSWKPKSWVVGVDVGTVTKAYDWNALVAKKLISDSLSTAPILLVLEADTSSFHVYNRTVSGMPLQFELSADGKYMIDRNTNSKWTKQGVAIEGNLQGSKLLPIRAYQEFWHSWQTFHPATLK